MFNFHIAPMTMLQYTINQKYSNIVSWTRFSAMFNACLNFFPLPWYKWVLFHGKMGVLVMSGKVLQAARKPYANPSDLLWESA